MELAEDETRRKQMGELGRKRVEEQLAWDHSRKVLVAAYDRLFEKMRTGRK